MAKMEKLHWGKGVKYLYKDYVISKARHELSYRVVLGDYKYVPFDLLRDCKAYIDQLEGASS